MSAIKPALPPLLRQHAGREDRPLQAAVVVFVLCAAATLWAWRFAEKDVQSVAHERFNAQVQSFYDALEQRMSHYEQMLRSASFLYAIHGEIGRAHV